MKIKSSVYCIDDDFGLQIEVKPLNKDVESKEAEFDIAEFFSKYRIVTAHKSVVIPSSQKELIERHQNIDVKKPSLANELTFVQRICIIRKMLPSEFNMKDFVNYVIGHEFNGGKYSEEDAIDMWKGVHAKLTKEKKIEIVNRGESKAKYKYRYIGTDTLEEIADIGIKKLMNGEKVVI